MRGTVSPHPDASPSAPPPPRFDTIPTVLQDTERWILWGGGPSKNGRLDKTPRGPDTRPISVTDPANWTSFTQAEQSFRDGRFYGVGFVMSDQDELMGIDLDHCVDDDGNVAPWAQAIIDEVDSYTEYSPSGNGVHIWVRSSFKVEDGNKRTGLGDDAEGVFEIYSSRRYFTVTGLLLWDDLGEVQDRTEVIQSLHHRMFGGRTAQVVPLRVVKLPARPDDEVIEMATLDPAWADLFSGDDKGDASEGDFIFCKILAKITSDDDQIDRIYRRSGRSRDKWDRPARSGETYGQGTINRARVQVLQQSNPAALTASPLDGFEYTDVGNAERLLEANPHVLRFVEEWGTWIVYEGGRWVRDVQRSRVSHLASQIAEPLLEYVGPMRHDPAKMKEFMRWYSSTRSANGIANTVRVASHSPRARVSHAELDARPWMLNTLNRTLDLEDHGYDRDPDPADLLTKRTAVPYVSGATCPLWCRFLEQILPDPDVREYVQMLAGLALIGEPQQILPILWGEGANGKSTLTEVLAAVLGEYAVKASQELLVIQKHQGHPTSKASLFGARFAHSGEIEQSDRLNEALVKELTGGDTIMARRMYENEWAFQPSHLLWLHANYRPRIQGNDLGIWRRVKLIPFNVTVPAADRVEGLARLIFKTEGSGVLNWMLQGLGEYRRNGYKLPDPPAVVEATAEYRRETDTVGMFLSDTGLVVGDGLTIKSSQLDMAHAVWYGTSTVRVSPDAHLKMVKAELRNRDCEPKQRRVDGKNTLVWVGVGIPEATLPEL